MTDSLHQFPIAPETGDGGSKRSLILAGGGMRVAYQAGVIRALFEADLTFFHADATSGGTINLAMLLSGLSPGEMCDRWRTLDIKNFVSLMPLEKYLKAYDLLAMGDADGIINQVFPHLGIDIVKINAAQGLQGTFNVCNYTRKTNEVITHQQIDLDWLVAGISLPILMPPVKKGDCLYTDSVWIKDANLMEAVKRGAEELWVVWCIGNASEYKTGFFNQYVHMIELSANGFLFEEFERINEINARIAQGENLYGHSQPIKLHLIKPEYPLPLDPDLYLGRIDTATLIDMGYADAKKYLQNRQNDGLPFQPEATKMLDRQLGITFRETMSGGFALGETDPRLGETKGKTANTRLIMHATITINDLNRFIADPNHTGSIAGHITFAPFGDNIPAKNGIFNLFSPTDMPKLKLMIYELAFEHDGQDYYLAGKKEVQDDPGFDLWKDTTTLYTQLHQGPDKASPVIGAGILSLGVDELAKLVSTLHATNAKSVTEQGQAIFRFGQFFLGQLWDTYGKKFQS
jgi:predicted acylesterase/phospholipase RssA